MKPRIKRISSLWRCTTLTNDGRIYRIVTGYGGTPADAYIDWLGKGAA